MAALKIHKGLNYITLFHSSMAVTQREELTLVRA